MPRKRQLGDAADRKRASELLKQKQQDWQKERLIAVRLGLNPDKSLDEIAEVVGRDRSCIQRWFDRFKQGGFKALLSRGNSGGRPSGCVDEVQAFLKAGLEAGKWNTAGQAKSALEKQFNQTFRYHTVWHWVKKCSGVLRRPRPLHKKQDKEQKNAYQRSFLGHLRKLELPAGKPVKVWFADESRYGLLPVIRRVWTLKGLRPHSPWQTKYQWSYCYGALDVVEGDSVFMQSPSVNHQWTHQFLKQICKEYPAHEHVVVWDVAGFHSKDSNHWIVPDGVHILTLPPYCPELNPIEKLWDLIQDHTANKIWDTIEKLDGVVSKLLENWWSNPRRVLRLVGRGYHRLSVNAS
ncbi:MAG: IS630 family transposase [Rhodobacterales bacterium]|jgi:transposase|nr:IS630 family transposase [Rhodobacterales bacterium]NCX59446.1 IS630 family transposase [Paracoccaceae bacterium]